MSRENFKQKVLVPRLHAAAVRYLDEIINSEVFKQDVESVHPWLHERAVGARFVLDLIKEEGHE